MQVVSVVLNAMPSETARQPVALVVDDSMLIRHSVCRYLEEHGFEVESATNGLEALAAVAARIPDIVITDFFMPKMNGSELITALKARPELAKMPIVMLAARASSKQAPLHENRADFVIYKDIDIEEQLELMLRATFPDKASS